MDVSAVRLSQFGPLGPMRTDPAPPLISRQVAPSPVGDVVVLRVGAPAAAVTEPASNEAPPATVAQPAAPAQKNQGPPVTLLAGVDEAPSPDPSQRMALHATALQRAERDAPPRMRAFLETLHGEVEDMAGQMEARGHRPNRESMFIHRLAQFIPTLSMPRINEPCDRRDDVLMGEITSDAGRAASSSLREHAHAWLKADRDRQLSTQTAHAQFTVPDAAERRAVNAAVIDRMLDSGTPDEQRAILQRDLGVLEPTLLRAAEAHGVKVFVAQPRMTSLPKRLYREDVDVKQLEHDWDTYRAANAAWEADHAAERAAIEKDLTGPHTSLTQLALQHKRLFDMDWDSTRPLRPPGQMMQVIDPQAPVAAPAIFTPYTITPLPPPPTLPTLPIGGGDFTVPMGGSALPVPSPGPGFGEGAFTAPPPPPAEEPKRALPALPRGWDPRERAAIPPAASSAGPLREVADTPPPPFGTAVPSPPAGAPAAAYPAPNPTMPSLWKGESMRDVALHHGAQTDAEIDEFCQVAVHQNGAGFDPHRPFQGGEIVIVPDYHYVDGRRISSMAMRLIENTDRLLANEPKTLGCYDDLSRMLMVRAEVLPDDNPICGQHRVAIHEFGHVAQALLEKDRAFAETHAARAEDIYWDNKVRDLGSMGMAGDELNARYGPAPTAEQLQPFLDVHNEVSPFVSPYAATKSGEHFAESFEAYYSAQLSPTASDPRALRYGNRSRLEESDPAMFLLVDDDIGRMRQGLLGP